MRAILVPTIVVLAALGAGHSSGLTAAGAPGQPSPPHAARRPALFKDSRQTLAVARGQGRADVVLLVAARAGAADAVAREAARIGGNVRFRRDDVGYLRVRVPVDRASSFARFESIESVAADVDDSYPIRLEDADQAPPAAQAHREEWPPKPGDYPLRHPYTPLKDLDAADFRSKHPTWDGRGVTIAVLDGNFDLLLPEFQTAYAIDGKPVPKVADYVTVTDPRDDAQVAPQWVDMRARVTAAGGRVSAQGRSFSVARDGAYRIGLFSERRFGRVASYIDQDIDRNGNPKGDDGVFGVLWDEQANDVWVDTDRDGSFADEKAMTDYRTRGDVGVLGTDDPKTPFRDSVGFAVQTDKVNTFVAINVGIYQHSTGILGAVAGNRQPNGRLDGLAPGARLLSIGWGSSGHSLIEGLITAFEHPLADLIVLEQSVAIASIPYTLADGRHPISVIAQRLTERHDKLLFVPGSNLPAFALVAEDGLAPGVMSVGGYQSRESYRSTVGFVPEHEDNLHWGALSHGPGTTGALKPDLLAPSGLVSTEPGYRKGETSRGLFQLPPGYGVGGGTSTATPMAAGAAALIVSAARQSGVPVGAARLKAALTRSARYIPRLPVHEQGHGLIQIGAAFEQLKAMAAAPRADAGVRLQVRAPVKHKLSALLETPGEGDGIYEREGWKQGDRGERTITVTRTSGPAEPMTFALEWLGNDGTFSSQGSVTLPLGRPAGVPVMISAGREGPHSAILSFNHPSISGYAHRMLNTIVVAHPFTEANGYSVKTELTPPVPGDASVFVDVPAGVSALTVSTSPGVRLWLVSPTRDVAWRAPCPAEPQGGRMVCSTARPAPGVWEINVSSQAGRTYDPDAPSPIVASKVSVTATILGIGVEGSVPSFDARPGASHAVSLSLRNQFGRIGSAVGTTPLGSAWRTTATIAAGEQQVYEIIVPKGAASVRAAIARVGDAGADLDLYLLDCTEPEKAGEPPKEMEKGNKAPAAPDPACAARAKADDRQGESDVEVAQPRAGRWLAVVDAFAIPSGKTAYDYLDLVVHPRFGTLSVADVPDERAPSAAWDVKGHIWVAEAPEAPRHLHARVLVTSGAISQPVRTVEGFGTTGVVNWLLPIGMLDVTVGAR